MQDFPYSPTAQEQPQSYYPQQQQQQTPYFAPQEAIINNIVSQIDPQQIIDNLDHSLKGELYNKEKGIWEKNPNGKPLANDACRSAIMSYISGLLTNNTTMSIIDANQLSAIMESCIESITRMFIVNLEEFGFVPPGIGYAKGEFENKGIPDTARMTMVSNMIYAVVFLVLTRGLNGMESRKIFGSLSMVDTMGYGGQGQQQSGSWLGKLFGR